MWGSRELRQAQFLNRTSEWRASLLNLPRFQPPGCARSLPTSTGEKMRREGDVSGRRVPVAPCARGNRVHRLPKWYWAITLSDETVER
jgi:hypothetical protein